VRVISSAAVIPGEGCLSRGDNLGREIPNGNFRTAVRDPWVHEHPGSPLGSGGNFVSNSSHFLKMAIQQPKWCGRRCGSDTYACKLGSSLTFLRTPCSTIMRVPFWMSSGRFRTLLLSGLVCEFMSCSSLLARSSHTLQGNAPPPATPSPRPPASQPFGPPVPPGFVRYTPAITPNSRDQPNASDRLRSIFKCPKFVGEVQHWKVWNQGFARFLSINKLDHVIERRITRKKVILSKKEKKKHKNTKSEFISV
jgi:hypothetical protein